MFVLALVTALVIVFVFVLRSRVRAQAGDDANSTARDSVRVTY